MALWIGMQQAAVAPGARWKTVTCAHCRAQWAYLFTAQAVGEVLGGMPEEALRRARANHALLLAGTRTEDLLAAEAHVAEARGKLREIEANLREAVVRASEAAVVEVLAVRKGDLVLPNQTIVRVLRADDLWVKVYVPETQLGKVRVGQNVEVLIDSYPDKPFVGRVIQVAGESGSGRRER